MEVPQVQEAKEVTQETSMTGANQEARHALQKRGEKSILKNLRSGAHNVPDLAQINNEYILPQNKRT